MKRLVQLIYANFLKKENKPNLESTEHCPCHKDPSSPFLPHKGYSLIFLSEQSSLSVLSVLPTSFRTNQYGTSDMGIGVCFCHCFSVPTESTNRPPETCAYEESQFGQVGCHQPLSPIHCRLSQPQDSCHSARKAKQQPGGTRANPATSTKGENLQGTHMTERMKTCENSPHTHTHTHTQFPELKMQCRKERL
jgi:hypothetical protein